MATRWGRFDPSISTVVTRWRGLRGFTNWLLVADLIKTGPPTGIIVEKPGSARLKVRADQAEIGPTIEANPHCFRYNNAHAGALWAGARTRCSSDTA